MLLGLVWCAQQSPAPGLRRARARLQAALTHPLLCAPARAGAQFLSWTQSRKLLEAAIAAEQQASLWRWCWGIMGGLLGGARGLSERQGREFTGAHRWELLAVLRSVHQ